MARRIENECAFCAEMTLEGEQVVGKDWKVYCSETCAEEGEKMSAEEWSKVMRTEGQGEKEAGRQGGGEKVRRGDLNSPLLPVSPSPSLSFSPSLRPPLPISLRRI